MLKYILCFLLSGALAASAQSTVVSGTLVDPSGNTWSAATITAVFTDAPGIPGPYNWDGGTLNKLPATVTSSSGGTFSITLPTNVGHIFPSGSTWLFSICPNASLQCAVVNVALSGSTFDIVPTINGANAWPTGNVIPTPVAKVYNTNQTANPPQAQGGMVYNTTNQTMNIYTSAGWQPFAFVGGNPVITNPTGNQTITQPANSNFNVITSGTGNLLHNGDPVLDTTSIIPASQTSGLVETNPTGTQSIQQSSSTSLNINILNSEYNANMFSGSDIGAKINNAIAAISCGTILIPAGNYNYSTTIIKPRCILLQGQGLIATKLNYTQSSGVALIVADAASPSQYGVGGVSNLALIGTGIGLGTSNTSVGIWLGGDPAWGAPCGGSGSSGVVPCDYNADNQVFTNIGISNFEIGLQTANNAYVDTFTSSNINSNWYGVSQAANSTNAGEDNRFITSDIFNNAGAGFYVANGWKLFGTSIDFNNDGTSTTLATHAQIIDTSYECFGCHAEAWSGAVSSGVSSFNWYGGNILLDSSAAITDPFLLGNNIANTPSKIIGTDIFSAHTVTALISSTGGAQSSVTIEELSGNGNGNIGLSLSSVSNPGLKFINPKIQFIDGGDKTINGNFTLTQNSGGWQKWSISNTAGLSGLQLLPLGNNSIFITDTNINANPFDMTVKSISPLNGFTGTKTAGACTFTITSGIITAVSGC